MVLGFLACSNNATEPELGHIPDLTTMSGTLDLFAFCFLVILGNVLDFRTYTNAMGNPPENVELYDQNGIALEERVNICQARGVCLELLRWWESNFRIINPATIYSTGDAALTTRLIVSQAFALLKYKESAEKDEREGAPGCTASLLTHQIENIISIIPGGLPEWERIRNAPNEVDITLGFNEDDWVLSEIVDKEPRNYRECKFEASALVLTPFLEAPKDFVPIGYTQFDMQFMEFCGGRQISTVTRGPPSAKRVRYV
jgi:hypothetical protein